MSSMVTHVLSQLRLYVMGMGWTSTTDESVTATAHPGIMVDKLGKMNPCQRAAFMVMVGLLFVVAFTGNICSLYVNQRRKLRPFFRACLISLACSDLLSCIFSSIAYISQFGAEYLQMWVLGPVMCKFVPFAMTAAVLSSSLTLVAIALDRYMIIMRLMLGVWNPSLIFCSLCMSAIWFVTLGTAAPLLAIYKLVDVTVLDVVVQEGENGSELLVTELQVINMCVSEDRNVGLYYVILFSIIFVPCIVAFLWLNTIIVQQLWRRRKHPPPTATISEPRVIRLQMQLEKPGVAATGDDLQQMSTSPPSMISVQVTDPPLPLGPAAMVRQARHRRMVQVVLLMMACFLFLRMPSWIFVLLRVFGTFSSPLDWMLYFSFAILNLTNCALNPLFYTFLAETLRYLSLIKQKLGNIFCSHCSRRHDSIESEMSTGELQDDNKCCYCCCCCCRLRPTVWRCHLSQSSQIDERSIDNPENNNKRTSIFIIRNQNEISMESSSA